MLTGLWQGCWESVNTPRLKQEKKKQSTSENQMSEPGLRGGLGEVGCCSLACDSGWRGVAPSVAVFFQCNLCSGDGCEGGEWCVVCNV